MIDQSFLGGGQIALLSLAKSLDRNKFEVSVSAREGGPLVDEVKKNNLAFFSVPFQKKYDRRIIDRISRLLEENQIDILHTHGGIAGFYGRWAARRCRIPVIIHTLHGIHYLHYQNIFLKWIYVLLERYFSRFTDGIIFVSEADFESGKKYKLAPESRMYLIKNGADFFSITEKKLEAMRIDEMRFKLGLESDTPVIGTVARLHRQKGIIYLLRAAPIIHRQFPGVKILIAGGGPLEKKLRRKARRLGKERYFFLLGERSDVQTILSFFDIFVLPSLWEGLPLVLLEAAAAGKPIVATDIDGVREILRDRETGILVPPKNPEKLAQAIICLLQDRQLAQSLGRKAQEVIPSRYPLAKMVEQTQNLYLHLCQDKRI